MKVNCLMEKWWSKIYIEELPLNEWDINLRMKCHSLMELVDAIRPYVVPNNEAFCSDTILTTTKKVCNGSLLYARPRFS